MMPKPKNATHSARRALETVRGLHASAKDPLAWVIWMPADCSPRPPQVLPSNDTREHLLETFAARAPDGRPSGYDKSCWCDPTYTEEGILVHNAADGRERYEPDTGVLQHKKN